MSPTRATFALLVAALIWGFGFLPQGYTAKALGAGWAVAIRFIIVAPIVWVIAWNVRHRLRDHLKRGIVLGVILAIVFWVQTMALLYTPTSRVALFTGLYAVFTPILGAIIHRTRPPPLIALAAIGAFFGTALSTGIFDKPDAVDVPFNVGDVMAIAQAVLAALHIVLVGRAPKDTEPRLLNAIQLTVVTLLVPPLALLTDGLPNAGLLISDVKLLAAFAFLALFATALTFYLQMASQKALSAPTASLLMQLETPAGLLFGVWLLSESFTPLQWTGAVVVLAAVGLALWAESRAAPQTTSTTPG